ncbi:MULTISPECIES: hypothetical protein [Pseudomonas]|jgi:hypothetical protein|uniref:Lipoprotein n=1 Tax=Pseudomonas koreensis TaxID=198620 RepID=A0AA94EHR8_9PSED|nr:hypothetical protein [Pseudomonas koreensis]RVD74570.1 hypothetical protein A9HBioS_5551 [Pseudomonas koreensis]
MRYLASTILMGLMALLSGCNTTPYDKATIYYDRTQFPAQIVKDDPSLSDPILQHGRCSLIVSTPGSNTGSYYFCTYALTAKGLYVQGWDAKALKYEEIMHVDFATLRKISLASFLRTNQLQLTEERRQSALSACIDEGGYIDTAATERLFETIKGKGVAVVKSEGMMNPPAPPSPVFVPIIIPR